MTNNMVYEALLEGRYRPEISVTKLENGHFQATFEAHDGTRIQKQDYSHAEAYRQCEYEVIEGVKQGKIHPFR